MGAAPGQYRGGSPGSLGECFGTPAAARQASNRGRHHSEPVRGGLEAAWHIARNCRSRIRHWELSWRTPPTAVFDERFTWTTGIHAQPSRKRTPATTDLPIGAQRLREARRASGDALDRENTSPSGNEVQAPGRRGLMEVAHHKLWRHRTTSAEYGTWWCTRRRQLHCAPHCPQTSLLHLMEEFRPAFGVEPSRPSTSWRQVLSAAVRDDGISLHQRIWWRNEHQTGGNASRSDVRDSLPQAG